MSTHEEFTLFWKGPFSQWYPSNFKSFPMFKTTDFNREITFCNAEQWMMFNKALLFNDIQIAYKILETSSPSIIKNLGQKVRNFNETKWNQVKQDIVHRGTLLKFTQNHNLKNQLLETRDTTLAEASPYDRIWGIGLGETDPKVRMRGQWKGLNLLGKILTEVRDEMLN